MKNILERIPFLRIVISLIIGIVVSSTFPDSLDNICILLIFVLLLFLWFTQNFSGFNFQRITSISICLTISILGFYIHQLYNKKKPLAIGQYYLATILEKPVLKTNSYKAELKLRLVLKDDSVIKTNEKIIAYFEPDSLVDRINTGSQIIFNTAPQQIANAGNPGEFDYAGYMSKKKVFRQVYLKNNCWQTTQLPPSHSLKIIAEKQREKLLDIYRKNKLEGNQFAILSALTLGYKQALDKETKEVFSSAGAMHILAVSGLHVGIIFLVFNFFFGFMKRRKKGRIIFVFLSITSLWIFAFITGLSASVLRASLMFTFVIIGDTMRKPSNIYNSLFASAFILLLINPNFIFDVGFQLSYSAVLGILFFQPRIFNLIKFKSKIANFFWALFTVSIAVQITTFPLSIFYFNQFVSYFWLSNFIVIPSATLFIISGILILVFSPIQSISIIITKITAWLLAIVYEGLKQISELPYSTIQNINLNQVQLFLLIIGVFWISLFIATHKKLYLFFFLSFLIVVSFVKLIYRINQFNQELIIAYNCGNNQLFHFISGKKNYIISGNYPDLTVSEKQIIDNTCTKMSLKAPVYLNSSFNYEDQKLYLNNYIVSFCGQEVILKYDKLLQGLSKNTKFLFNNKRHLPAINQNITIISTAFSNDSIKSTNKTHYLRQKGAMVYRIN